MKTTTFIMMILLVPAASIHAAPAATEDPVPAKLREAYQAYRADAVSEAIAALRETIELLEERTARLLADRILPRGLGEWRGETASVADTRFAGGGSSVSRLYRKGARTIVAKVVVDSPLVAPLVGLLADRDLLDLAGATVESIRGEPAVIEEPDGDDPASLRMAVDGRIYIELLGSEGVRVAELVAAARRLDLRALAGMR